MGKASGDNIPDLESRASIHRNCLVNELHHDAVPVLRLSAVASATADD